MAKEIKMLLLLLAVTPCRIMIFAVRMKKMSLFYHNNNNGRKYHLMMILQSRHKKVAFMLKVDDKTY